MRTYKHIFVIPALLLFAGCSQQEKEPAGKIPVAVKKVNRSNRKIQVALLLDTSGSMDGLIEQAKAVLWNTVNTLSTLRYDGQIPAIEIALYEYGNDNIVQDAEYVKQITGFTTDLDLLSEKLFSLTTNGGSEYCGSVIRKAVNQLDWGHSAADMRLVYIAGNEEFNQGTISYLSALELAREKQIYVNTIFCGSKTEGINILWQDGAVKGKGNYFSIDQNQSVAFIETPYDQKINQWNLRLNDTYVFYSSEGKSKKANQLAQDANASTISYSCMTDRAVSKSRSVYNNASWDLVDRLKNDKNALKSLKKEELPDELKTKSAAEVEAYVKKQDAAREKIRNEITRLSVKRQEYITEKLRRSGTGDDLGKAIRAAILKLAKEKGYTVQG